ncbi:MAG TPA: HEAT repeat domain-containing protein [Phycisphaerae bacterium]|mgnify:CR=1 FL=1|nr:HEAT repeat domain-containing protein [Phycisphaerae bacterium]
MSVCSTRGARFVLMAAFALAIAPAGLYAQDSEQGMVGQDKNAWEAWKSAQRVIERGDLEEAAPLFDTIAAMNISDLRIALMADRTGSTRLEYWAQNENAPLSVKSTVEKILNGRRQRGLAEDGWHLAAVGRFKFADANFKALIESNPDPVALLELARQNPNRHDVLVKLINNTEVGESAVAFLKLLEKGEEALRTDPFEIETHISRLSGSPRMVYNATNRLRDSGEYAVPHLIQALQDPNRSEIHATVIQVLSDLGRGALNPLVQAFGIKDDVTKVILIKAAGDIGYKQSVPYLVELIQDENEAPAVKDAAREALRKLGASEGYNLASLFLELGNLYYDGADSLLPVKALDTANIWYLRDQELRYVAVPRDTFIDIMAMRCAEETLKYAANTDEAIALWLAANTRREAKLGMNVESDQPDPLANKDSTRPENTPRSIYFNRAAGAKYDHMMLARAVKGNDVGVALGAIAALRSTAGEANLIGGEDYKQALVQAMSFPNRQVRFKAAEALALSTPDKDFTGSQNVVPVLGESLKSSSRRAALIAIGDVDLRNKFQALLRAANFETAAGGTLYEATRIGREQAVGAFDVVLLGLDITQPDVTAAIAELRKDFATASVPILLVSGDIGQGNRVARGQRGVEVLDTTVIEIGDVARITEIVSNRINRAAQALGMTGMNENMSLALALRAADAIRAIGLSSSKIFDVSRAEPAMISAIKGDTESLRVRVAGALSMVGTATAQETLAEVAMMPDHAQAERIAQFDALAESARLHGNQLGEREVVSKLIEFTMKESDLVLRAAASKALGALDLPSNKASEIISAQHNG